MSTDEFYCHDEEDIIIMTVRDLRKMLEKQTKLTLGKIIEHNAEKNKPRYHNVAGETTQELMTTLLQMETSNESQQ